MCGAQAALIGMAAACTDVQAELLDAYWRGRPDRFLALNAAVDDLARHTFLAPMEGYIQRMLWCLVHQGVIPIDASFDPWGPPLDREEFDRIGGLPWPAGEIANFVGPLRKRTTSTRHAHDPPSPTAASPRCDARTGCPGPIGLRALRDSRIARRSRSISPGGLWPGS